MFPIVHSLALSLTVLVGLIVVNGAQSDVCGSLNANRSMKFDGSCFVLSEEAKRFTDAKTACTELPNGRLANLRSRQQVDALWEIVQKQDEDRLHAWLIIGIVRPRSAGTDSDWRMGWRYVDGEGNPTDDATHFTDLLWKRGEPNGASSLIKEEETRLIYDADNNGQPYLYDHRPTTDLYLCEYLPSSYPTSTSSTTFICQTEQPEYPEPESSSDITTAVNDESDEIEMPEKEAAVEIDSDSFNYGPIFLLLAILLIATAFSFIIWRRWRSYPKVTYAGFKTQNLGYVTQQNVDNDLDILVQK